MNKQELIEAVAAKSGNTQAAVKKDIDAFLAVIGEAMAKGDRVTLVGFGSFFVQDVPERTGRNPQTGQPIKIKKRKKVKFKAGAELSGKVN